MVSRMMNSIVVSFCTAGLMLLLATNSVHSQTLAVDFDDSTATITLENTLVSGILFQVTTAIDVTHLGADFEGNGTGPTTQAYVTICEMPNPTTGILIADEVVNSTDPLIGAFNFREDNVAAAGFPRRLEPGRLYYLEAWYQTLQSFEVPSGSPVAGPEIQLLGGMLTSQSALLSPPGIGNNSILANGYFFGPSFIYTTAAPTVTPEPGTLALLAALGVCGAGFALRARKR